MIDVNILYQINLFANLSDVSMTSENMVKLLGIFSEYDLLPSTINEINNPNLGSVISPELRPKFQTATGEFSISIFSQSIEIERVFAANQKESIEEFVEKSSNLLRLFMKEFNKKGSRLSLVSRAFLNEMTEEELHNMYNKSIKPINFYANENDTFEWKTRTVRRVDYIVSGVPEITNVITEIGRVQGKIMENGVRSEFDRISFDVDINTIPRNEDTRFTDEAIPDFLQQALQTRDQLINDLEVVVNG